MRVTLALLSVVLCGNPLFAAPRAASAKPVGPPLTFDEAQAFALQVKDSLDRIAKQYARPVSRAELTVAALTGLYRAAGASVSSSLAAEIKNGRRR